MGRRISTSSSSSDGGDCVVRLGCCARPPKCWPAAIAAAAAGWRRPRCNCLAGPTTSPKGGAPLAAGRSFSIDHYYCSSTRTPRPPRLIPSIVGGRRPATAPTAAAPCRSQSPIASDSSYCCCCCCCCWGCRGWAAWADHRAAGWDGRQVVAARGADTVQQHLACGGCRPASRKQLRRQLLLLLLLRAQIDGP